MDNMPQDSSATPVITERKALVEHLYRVFGESDELVSALKTKLAEYGERMQAAEQRCAELERERDEAHSEAQEWQTKVIEAGKRMVAAESRCAELERRINEVLYYAYKFDDKPHRLFSGLRVLAEGNRNEKEIARLMNDAYEHIHGWQAAESAAEKLRAALRLIAEWPFDIMGDCVADAKRVARKALEDSQ